MGDTAWRGNWVLFWWAGPCSWPGLAVTQSCLTLCNPMDCSPPGSSVHGILQARILEWVAIMFSKSFLQFSVGGWGCVPSLLFTWGQTMVEVKKIMATSIKRSHACTATLSAPRPASGHRWPRPPREAPGHLWASLGQSLVGSLLLSPGSWCIQGSVFAYQESVSQSCVSSCGSMAGFCGDLLQGGLCHTQVCCIQSPCPYGSPLLISTSTGDTQTQFCLSLWGVSESWCAQGLFEPSELFWQDGVWF